MPLGSGITLTPEKLEMLAQNFDPKVLFSILGQGGGIVSPTSGSDASFTNFANPAATAKPSPLLSPQALAAFLPKPPQVLPPAGLAPQRQVQAPGQFAVPLQPQDSFSRILQGR